MELEELTLKGYDLGKLGMGLGYFSFRTTITDLLVWVKLVDTVAEAKRLVVGAAVTLNGEVITNTYKILTGRISDYQVGDYLLAFLTVGEKKVMLYIKREGYK
jgi:ribosome-associated protein YbcJ (S4-like RNA binding protein)